MNTRYIIIAFIMVLILAIFIVAFMGIVLKDGTPIKIKVAPSKTQETGAIEEPADSAYNIPSNTMPTYQELEDSAKRSEDRRAAYKELCAQIEKERLKRKASQKAAQQPPPDRSSAVLQDKNVTMPTIEERKEMESKGVISF